MLRRLARRLPVTRRNKSALRVKHNSAAMERPDHVLIVDDDAEIRALLLAALRSAVLWRQSGGSLLDFVFRRREMAAAIDSLMR